MHLNFNESMIPGLCALLVGAVLSFGAGKLCHKEKDVPVVKAIGLALALVGAILVFIP